MPSPRRFLAVVAVCGIAACSHSDQLVPAKAAATTASQPAPPLGIDLSGIDPTVTPGDDFDGYANGVWRKTASIPSDLPGTGVFLQLFLQAEQRTSELIRGLAASGPAVGTNGRRIADYYAAYMDEAHIEQRGLGPLAPQLAKIAAIKSPSQLARMLGSELRADVDPINATHLHTERLFGLFVTQGLEDPQHHVAYLLQGGLGLPDRDYYVSKDEAMVSLREAYRDYAAKLLSLAGIAASAAKASAILALETKIAAVHATIVESEDVHKANNPWPLAVFDTHAPGIDWRAFFEAAGLAKQPHVVAWQPEAIRGIAELVKREPLETWKTWLAFHTLNLSASLLPKAYAELAFDFYGRKLQGTPAQRDRWKRAVASTNRALGDAVGELYVQRYFPPSSRARVQTMVENIIAAFRARVDTLTWMSSATKEKAKAKASTLRVGIGYPDRFRDYAPLDVRADDPLGNAQRASLFEYQHQLVKLDAPVDKGEWWMTPQTVNALNLPLQNAMNFPAAILEAPFFDPAADAAANYGAIGAIIGHEISHSFDNIGAEFDADGKLANWWTPEDAAHFKAAAERLVAQYNAYEALPGMHVNGQQTLGENIADLSGLTIAHTAYVTSLAGRPAPILGGLGGEQRFFLAFGQAWRQKLREAAMRQRLAVDVHAPSGFRAQTVRNVDAWYEAFPVEPTQKLYLRSEERVRIW